MNETEKLQKLALRFLWNDFDSSYETLLQRSGKTIVDVGNLRKIHKEIFKLLNCLGAATGDVQETCNFIKNETLAQGFFCEFCEKHHFYGKLFGDCFWQSLFWGIQPSCPRKSYVRYLLNLERQKYTTWLIMYHLPCDFSYDFWFYIKAVEKGGQGGRPLTLSTQPFYLGFSASNKKSTSKKEPTSVFEITIK